MTAIALNFHIIPVFKNLLKKDTIFSNLFDINMKVFWDVTLCQLIKLRTQRPTRQSFSNIPVRATDVTLHLFLQ